MKIKECDIDGLLLIELPIYLDERGYFTESFNNNKFKAVNLPDFVQDNHSYSLPGVIRGLHIQLQPKQGKLVRASRGRIYDVAVDLRANSATYGHYYGVELSAANGRLLWIPAGFAHGFCVLGDESADVIYKVDQYYNPNSEISIHWNDPTIDINWPITPTIISKRDQRQAISLIQYNNKQSS